MPQLALNQNQFAPSMVIGAAAETNFDTVTCQINPNTTAAYITAGCAVKLISNTGPEKVVDVTAGPTDGPVYGVIAYNLQLNVLAASGHVEVHTTDNFVWLKSAGAITRGARVSITNPTATGVDPTIASDASAGDYTIGVAETQCSAAGVLVKVRVKPGINVSISGTVYPLPSP